MTELDLIPADYARERLLRRRLRVGLALCVALACAVVLARAVLGTLVAAEKGQVSRLQEKKQLWQQARTKTEEYTSQAQATEKQLAALDELRGRDRLRLFLEAMDGAYVGKVWFDEIRYYRHENLPRLGDAPASGARTANAAAAQQAKPPAAPPMEQRAGMTGHAMNHVTLAEFMKKLENQPGVRDLNLLDTSPRRYPNALIIDFKLALQVDQKKVRSGP